MDSFACAYSGPSASLLDFMDFPASLAHRLDHGMVRRNYNPLSHREMADFRRISALSKISDDRKANKSPQIADPSSRQHIRYKASDRLSSLFKLKLVRTNRGSWKLIVPRFTKPRFRRTQPQVISKICSTTSSRSTSPSPNCSAVCKESECDAQSRKDSICDSVVDDTDPNDVEPGGKKRKHESSSQINSNYTHAPQRSFSSFSYSSNYAQQLANNDDAATAELEVASGSSKKPKQLLEDPLHCPHVGATTIASCGRDGHEACGNRRSNFKGHATFSHVQGHLNNCHCLLFCLMCWETFKTVRQYRNHDQTRCTQQNIPADFHTGWPAEYFQLENCQLFLRCMNGYADLVGAGSDLSDEEKWYKTWHLLHPGLENMAPSCYFQVETPSTTTTNTDLASIPEQSYQTRVYATASRMRNRQVSAPPRPFGSQAMNRNATVPGFPSFRSDSGGYIPPGTMAPPRTVAPPNAIQTTGELNPGHWLLSMQENTTGQTASRMLQDLPQNVLAFVSSSNTQQVPGMPADIAQAQRHLAMERSRSARLAGIAENPLSSRASTGSGTSRQPATDALMDELRHQQPQQSAEQHFISNDPHASVYHDQPQLPHLISNIPRPTHYHGQQAPPPTPQLDDAIQPGLAFRPGPARPIEPADTALNRIQVSLRDFRRNIAGQRLQDPAFLANATNEQLQALLLSACHQLNDLENIARGRN